MLVQKEHVKQNLAFKGFGETGYLLLSGYYPPMTMYSY